MMKEMYKGIVNSPITSLSEDIGAKDTDIKVVDSSYLPAAPNLAVIGTEGTAETIKYAGINENILTGCTRGFQGVAKAWDKDTLIARNFTEYDLAAVQENIQTLDSEKASNQEFKDFQGSIQEQLNEHEAQAETNLKNYAKKTDLSAAETRLDKKIDAKVSTTTFEDFKNTNQTALDKKTNNTDFDIYKKEVTSNLAKKVDKISGKGLSTNDYDNTEKAEVAKIKNLATSETVAGIKSEVETLKTSKVDKVVGKGLSTNDYDNTEKAEVAKIKNKADKKDLDLKIDKTSITSDITGYDENKVLSQEAGYSLLMSVDEAFDLTIDKTSITSDLEGADENKVLSQKGASELNKKFDTIGSSRSATIVIANYDSTEKSKKGADYVVKKGEDASKVIMNAEQELVGFGGKILLMEGKYDCQSAIVLGYAESILEGINATLVQNENWSETKYGDSKKSIEIIMSNSEMNSVIINNIKIIAKGIKDSSGIYCAGSSQVNNCTVSGTNAVGIYCTDSSQVNNCTVSDTISNSGIYCQDSSQVSNCTVSGSGSNGITCTDSSQVNNCTVSGTAINGIICRGSSQVNNCTVSGTDAVGIYCQDSSQVNSCTVSGTGSSGIYCAGSFVGVFAFNTLKGDTLKDDSSTPAKVEYNVIQ